MSQYTHTAAVVYGPSIPPGIKVQHTESGRRYAAFVSTNGERILVGIYVSIDDAVTARIAKYKALRCNRKRTPSIKQVEMRSRRKRRKQQPQALDTGAAITALQNMIQGTQFSPNTNTWTPTPPDYYPL